MVVDAEQHPANLSLRHLVGEPLDIESIHEAVPAFSGHFRKWRKFRLDPQRFCAVRVAKQDAVLIVQENAKLGIHHPTRIAGTSQGLREE